MSEKPMFTPERWEFVEADCLRVNPGDKDRGKGSLLIAKLNYQSFVYEEALANGYLMEAAPMLYRSIESDIAFLRRVLEYFKGQKNDSAIQSVISIIDAKEYLLKVARGEFRRDQKGDTLHTCLDKLQALQSKLDKMQTALNDYIEGVDCEEK